MLYTNHLIEHQKYYSDLASNADPDVINSAEVFLSERESGDVVIFELPSITNEAPEQSNPENTNIDMAKEISKHRQNLVQALAQIPLTALCLLRKHEHCNPADDSAFNDNEAESQFSNLSLYYQAAQQLALNEGLNSLNFYQAKQKLAECLQTFVFSAEQLKNIATLVIFAFYQSNQQPVVQGSSKQKIAFEKILNLSNLSSVQLQQDLKQLDCKLTTHSTLSNFLLPPAEITQTLVERILISEQLWLKTRKNLAEANTRLVLYISNQYKGSFLEFNDLVQEGQSGLLKAVDRFDYQRGFQFSTYAAYWIRQAISRALTRNERIVRLPFGKMANVHKVNRAKHQLFALKGSEPTIKELAAYTQLSEADVANILIIAQTATSLDAPVDEGENSVTRADYLEQQVFKHPLNKISESELTEAINQAISFLSPKEAQVINCRFGINSDTEMTLEEIGRELNLTRERVRQIQISAMQKIKRQFGSQLSIFL